MIFIPKREAFEKQFDVYDLENNLLGQVQTEEQIRHLRLQCFYLNCALKLVDSDNKEYTLSGDEFRNEDGNLPDFMTNNFSMVMLLYPSEKIDFEVVKRLDNLTQNNILENLAKDYFKNRGEK